MPITFSKIKSPELKKFFLIHLGITATCLVASFPFLDENQWQNFVLGQAYIWLSLVTYMLSVLLLFWKKSVALLTAVIVFKWPILIYVVFRTTALVQVDGAFMALGFLPVLLSSLIWAFLQRVR